MAYTITDSIFGSQAIEQTSSSKRHPLGLVVTAVDPTYGAGKFVYAKGAASTGIGSWALLNFDDGSTTLLAADMKGPVGVAMAANVANLFGWYQVYGKAVGKALAGYVDNALVYATATAGSVDDAVVSGDRVKNAIGASAIDTPTTGLAEFEVNFPFVDDGSAA